MRIDQFLLVTCIIFSCLLNYQCNTDKSNCKEKEFATLLVNTYDEYHRIDVSFFNSSRDTIALYIKGEVRHKMKSDIMNIFFDTIIEVEQNGEKKTSDSIIFNSPSLSERRRELIILYPNKEYLFNIFYIGNLRTDFKLKDKPFRLRLKIELEDSTFDSYMNEKEKELLRSNPNIKSFKENIQTSYISVE